jgi:hypothetical protein
MSSASHALAKSMSSRSALLASLQSKLFASPQALVVPSSQRHHHLLYHIPDIDPLKLSQQDKSLKSLELIDPVLKDKKERQDRYAARGKSIRVCVINGPQEPPAKAEGAKKKKKK